MKSVDFSNETRIYDRKRNHRGTGTAEISHCPAGMEPMKMARIHPMPKEFHRLPDGFASTVKRAVEAIVMVFGGVLRRPLLQQERMGGLSTDEEGFTKTSVGCQDVLREECREGSSGGYGLSRWGLRRWQGKKKTSGAESGLIVINYRRERVAERGRRTRGARHRRRGRLLLRTRRARSLFEP